MEEHLKLIFPKPPDRFDGLRGMQEWFSATIKPYYKDIEVTINTDDLLIFDSSIENEYLLLYRAGALSAGQLDEIRKNGLDIHSEYEL